MTIRHFAITFACLIPGSLLLNYIHGSEQPLWNVAIMLVLFMGGWIRSIWD